MQVLYLGKAPRTKETLLDFSEKCWVTRHSRVFRGLTGSQRTLGVWGVTKTPENSNFLKKGKMVISVKIRNFSRSWMTKRTLPLESSYEI